MLAAIRRRATRRNVIVAFLSLSMVTLITHAMAVPAYHGVASGFDPLNLQYRLTWPMLAIQRGAFEPGIGPVYLGFAVIDAVWQVALVMFLMLLWAWLMEQSPRPLVRNAVLLFPLLPALCGVAESYLIMQLVLADPELPLHELSDQLLTLHKIKFLLRDGNVAITVTLAVFAVYFRWRHGAPRTSP